MSKQSVYSCEATGIIREYDLVALLRQAAQPSDIPRLPGALSRVESIGLSVQADLKNGVHPTMFVEFPGNVGFADGSHIGAASLHLTDATHVKVGDQVSVRRLTTSPCGSGFVAGDITLIPS